MYNKKLIIGVLGMPDNQNTPKMIEALYRENNIHIDFVVYWKVSIKDQYARVKRKLKNGGILPTIQRIYYALTKSRAIKKTTVSKKSYREYSVPNHNSLECRKILAEENVDILILATDAIITHKVLEIPRIATLNAHPGWIPQFRGLGCIFHQLSKGYYPAVSVHKVDEGIDTGPLLLREYIKVDEKMGFKYIEKEVINFKHKFLAKVIKMYEHNNNIKYIDVFNEPSNVTRGIPSIKHMEKLDDDLISGRLKLRPILAE